MKKVVVLVMLTAGGYGVGRLVTLRAQTVQSSGQPASARAVDIPPVSNPPVYPDPLPKAMHWRADDLRKFHDARVAYARAHPDGSNPPPSVLPRVQVASFRTHEIGGASFQWKLAQPRPSKFVDVMSVYDDADQHQAVTDFAAFFGGRGQMVVDGVIENRVFGRKVVGGKTLWVPGELNGQPIKDGRTYDIEPGDWMSIPPNVPHMYLPADGEGMSYVNMKIYLGWRHPGDRY